MANLNTYTDEFRTETADYVISTGRPITEVSKELGLDDKTVHRWVQKRRGQLDGKVPSKQEADELKAAKKRIRELEMENEFLKKRAPSSQGTKRKRALRANLARRRRLPYSYDGPSPAREQVRLLQLEKAAP